MSPLHFYFKMNNTFTLYVHIAPNNKKYFGITSYPVEIRWQPNGKGYHTQQLFWRAIQKYGWDNFRHIILCENLSKNWACKLEQDFIRIYKSNDPNYGYNISTGGEYNSGYHWTDEQRKQASIRNSNRIMSEEAKHKISLALKGKPHSKEHNKKVSEANRGRKLSEEQRLNLSKAHLGKKISDEQKKKQSIAMKKYIAGLSEEERKERNKKFGKSLCIKVVAYKNEEFIGEFNSCRECADYLKVSPALICKILNGKVKNSIYNVFKK